MNITIEESTTDSVPSLLDIIVKNILSQSKTPDTLQKDFLFILIIVLMYENELLPLNSDFEMIDPMTSIDCEQLGKWKSSGSYEAQFVMPGLKNITTRLIMSPLGATVIINAVITELNSETYTVCLPVSRYVVSPQATTVPMIFRDLKHLSITFKSKIASVIKSRILTYHGYPSASLLGLPEEVLFKILLYVPIADILKVSATCSRLKYKVDNENFWHNLYKRDFHLNNSPPELKGWKEYYREIYVNLRDATLRQNVQLRIMYGDMDYADQIPNWGLLL